MPATTHEKSLEQQAIQAFRESLVAFRERQGTPNRPALAAPGTANDSPGTDSPGTAFVESEQYRAWVRRFPSGGPSGPGSTVNTCSGQGGAAFYEAMIHTLLVLYELILSLLFALAVKSGTHWAQEKRSLDRCFAGRRAGTPLDLGR
jgi:hypothetical protein